MVSETSTNQRPANARDSKDSIDDTAQMSFVSSMEWITVTESREANSPTPDIVLFAQAAPAQK